MVKMTNVLKVALLAGTGLGFLASPAWAQSGDEDEIIVTATKRATTILEAPLAVQAIAGDALEDQGIADFQDLVTVTPSFSFGDFLGTPKINVRGIESGDDGAFESAVGLFVDGVYYPRPDGFKSPYFDADRIEFLRGPQAVLYGLNSTAGVINIHSASNAPGDEFEGMVRAGYEAEYNGWSLEGAVGGGLSDKVGFRLAARISDTGDGYLNNLALGEDELSSEETIVRGTLVFEPSENISSTLKYTYIDKETSGTPTQQVFGGKGETVLDFDIAHDHALENLNVMFFGNTAGDTTESHNVSFSNNVALGEHTLDVNFGYADIQSVSDFDLDASAFAPSIFTHDERTHEQFSVDVLLSSPTGQKLEYLLGGYFSDATTGRDGGNFLDGTPFGFGFAEFGKIDLTTDTQILSVYGNATVNASEKLALTVGARYTNEDKDLIRDPNGLFCQWVDLTTGAVVFDPAPANVFCSKLTNVSASRSAGNFMPEAVLSYDYSDNVSLYAKVSKAARAGGFSNSFSVLPGLFEFDDEKALGFEAGLKSRFADRRGTFNLTAFHTKLTDAQVTAFDDATASAFVQNVGEATSQGIEAELSLRANDYVTLGGSVTLLNADIDVFPNNQCPVSQNPPAGCTLDSAGQPLPNAPKFSSTLFVDVDAPVSDALRFVGGVNLSSRSSYLTELRDDPVFEQGGYTRLEARGGIASADDKWQLMLIGRNLTNEAYSSHGVGFAGSFIQSVNRPRTITLQGTVNF